MRSISARRTAQQMMFDMSSPSAGHLTYEADWGLGTGVYGQASFRAGPVSASAGANLGRNFYSGGGNSL